MELHLSAITDHVAKENHTIDWEGVKFPARDTDWTARAVKEAVEIRKRAAHHQLPSLYSKLIVKLLVKKTLPFVTNGETCQHLIMHCYCSAKLICRYLTSNAMS